MLLVFPLNKGVLRGRTAPVRCLAEGYCWDWDRNWSGDARSDEYQDGNTWPLCTQTLPRSRVCFLGSFISISTISLWGFPFVIVFLFIRALDKLYTRNQIDALPPSKTNLSF
ncbi:hypothetical protein WAI453_003098 [Rhynchosporium graminicola]